MTTQKQNKPKAYIKADAKNSGALWLVVEREQKHPDENVAYAILEDEVEAIMQACNNYCVKRNQKNDK